MGTMPCGAPREWPPGETRHSHQAGRRDARRWPMSFEKDGPFTPPQGGEPERRRDKRRTRRKAGGAEETGPGALLPSEVLRNTGLLSHSAPPLLQLASLRRPGSRLPIDRQRSPPVVSTAFLVPGTHFSVTRYPGIPCGLAATESRQAAREALSQPPALSGPRACDPHGKGLSPRPLA
jgi:hypothetical protein